MPEVVVYALGGRSLDQKRGLMKDITDAVVKNFKVDPGAVVVTLVEILRPLRHVDRFAALSARHQRPCPDGHRDVIGTQLHGTSSPSRSEAPPTVLEPYRVTTAYQAARLT